MASGIAEHFFYCLLNWKLTPSQKMPSQKSKTGPLYIIFFRIVLSFGVELVIWMLFFGIHPLRTSFFLNPFYALYSHCALITQITWSAICFLTSCSTYCTSNLIILQTRMGWIQISYSDATKQIFTDKSFLKCLLQYQRNILNLQTL